MFDNTRVSAEIDHIQRTLSEVVALPQGTTLLVMLRREVDRPSHALLRQALFADCVRLAAAAVTVDLAVREPQVEAVGEFLAAAARHYAATLPATYRELASIDAASARAFLYRYAVDSGPFGQCAVQRWPGLELCREAEHLRHPEPRQRYTRLMGWLLDEARQLAAGHGPRWGNRGDVITELGELLGNPSAPAADPALQLNAFLTPTRVFSHVQYASSMFEADPFDVDTIFPTARRAFVRVLDQAAMPQTPSSSGWMQLLLGDSGSGKTHLLRSFRHHVQEHGRGFAAYAPLHTGSDDHARYLLQHVVDSLTRPYAGSAGEHTALYELASGVIQIAQEPLRSELLQLTEGNWEVTEEADTFAAYVHRLADQLQQHTTVLRNVDRDLIRAMLFALYPAPGMTSRVYRYLRCLDMSQDDRKWLGDIVPRTSPDDPAWMIRDLARFAFATRRAPFVIMVDQAERAIADPAAGGTALTHAVEILHGIVSEVPSLVAVVSYVTDIYNTIRPRLTKSVTDRIEVNPPPIRLNTQRLYTEIVAMVSHRLAWLYAGVGAVYRPDAPVYPFPEHKLRELNGFRARDVLAWCQRFQRQCVSAGRIIDALGIDEEPDLPPDTNFQLIATAWAREIEASDIEIPESEEEILELLAEAAADCAAELGLTSEHADATRDNLSAIRISLARNAIRSDIVIGWTHRDPRAGAFGAQLATLRKAARGAVPVAIRRGSFPRGVASERAMTTLRSAGGRCVSLDDATLRTLIAARRFRPVFPPERVLAWHQFERPISSLSVLAEILDLARLTPVSADKAGESGERRDRTSDTGNGQAAEPASEPPPRKPKARAASQNRRRQPTA